MNIQIHFDKLNIDETSRVEGEDQGYKLHIGQYRGNAGDSLEHDNGIKFSTPDRDNDNWNYGHCAQEIKGGWWFKGSPSHA